MNKYLLACTLIVPTMANAHCGHPEHALQNGLTYAVLAIVAVLAATGATIAARDFIRAKKK